MTSALATELKLEIVGHVRRNTGERYKATLSALSLVSRAWRVPAQISLFEEIKAAHGTAWDTQGFVKLFLASTHLCLHVFKLVVGKVERGFEMGPLSISQLLSLTALLPSLRTLVLHRRRISGSPLSEILRQSHHPFNLILSGCIIDADLSLLLRPFNVDFLCTVLSKTRLSGKLPDVGRLSSVKRLNLGMHLLTQRTISKYLLANCHSVISLGVDIALAIPEDLNTLQMFLRTDGRHLERLRVRVHRAHGNGRNGELAVQIMDFS